MKTIQDVFSDKKKVLISYLMIGDPDIKTSEMIIEKVLNYTDILELGVPFSDPVADGPTIQKAAVRSLKNKTNIQNMLKIVKNFRDKGYKTPIITMIYYNLILKYGIDRFIKDIKENGLNGALIPDLPIEESNEIREKLKENKLDFPMLITPTTDEERAEKIIKASTGFIYYVSYAGTTGSNRNLDYQLLQKNIEKIRGFSSLPIAVGFGIKDKKSVDKITSFADGAVVGSAIIKVIEDHLNQENLSDLVAEFVKKLR